MNFPKKYRPSEAPGEVIALVDRLMPMLLQGDHAALLCLREQYRRSQIKKVELTGVGFFVRFDIPEDVPVTVPASLIGGIRNYRDFKRA